MYLDPVNILQVVYAFVAGFGVVLVTPARRFSALRMLLALQSILMLFNLLEETGITRSFYLVTPIFTLGFGPAVYLFVRQLVCGRLPSGRLLALHFLPMPAALGLTTWPQFVIALGSISQAAYLTAAVLLVKRYGRASCHTHSDALSLKLNWLLVVLSVLLLMMLQDLVRLNLQPYAPLWLLKRWYFGNIAIDFAISVYLIYKAVHQPVLFEPLQEMEPFSEVSPAKDVSEAQVIFAQLDRDIRARELFRQPRLSLRDLSQISGLGEKTISWAINAGAGLNFCDYINRLRVEALCDKLQRGAQGETLLELALEAGFAAKSTFNTVFKKETGYTPSQYLRHLRSRRSES